MSNSLYVSCFRQKQNKAKTITPDYGAMKKIIDKEALYQLSKYYKGYYRPGEAETLAQNSSDAQKAPESSELSDEISVSKKQQAQQKLQSILKRTPVVKVEKVEVKTNDALVQ